MDKCENGRLIERDAVWEIGVFGATVLAVFLLASFSQIRIHYEKDRFSHAGKYSHRYMMIYLYVITWQVYLSIAGYFVFNDNSAFAGTGLFLIGLFLWALNWRYMEKRDFYVDFLREENFSIAETPWETCVDKIENVPITKKVLRNELTKNY